MEINEDGLKVGGAGGCEVGENSVVWVLGDLLTGTETSSGNTHRGVGAETSSGMPERNNVNM